MRKLVSFIVLCLCCYDIYAQVTEAYPTSQRYLFNPYNRNNVYIDSAVHWDHIYGSGDNDNHSSGGEFYPCNEYQMYPLPYDSTIQVYGVAIPLDFRLPIPLGSKQYGFYWEEDNLGPRDDSIRNLYWQTFVDSMHVLWSGLHNPLTTTGERRIHERYIYLVQKNIRS